MCIPKPRRQICMCVSPKYIIFYGYVILNILVYYTWIFVENISHTSFITLTRFGVLISSTIVIRYPFQHRQFQAAKIKTFRRLVHECRNYFWKYLFSACFTRFSASAIFLAATPDIFNNFCFVGKINYCLRFENSVTGGDKWNNNTEITVGGIQTLKKQGLGTPKNKNIIRLIYL